MATHINTTNAIKGLTCAASNLIPLAALDGMRATALRAHVRKHLVAAGLEIERLNSEAIKLRQRVTHLEEFNSSFEPKWDSLIFAIMGTDAGKNICSKGHDKTTELAIQAIHKTESDRKESLRTAEAFQEVASHPQAPKTHKLKIIPEYFQAVIEGDKTAELRMNDRDFTVGDYLLLAEWDEESFEYSGREITVKIIHITQCNFAVPNYVMLSFSLLEMTEEIFLAWAGE
ncbi:TPA: ASCH/PUA domain-containing protein [Yersinia enterocolitica]